MNIYQKKISFLELLFVKNVTSHTLHFYIHSIFIQSMIEYKARALDVNKIKIIKKKKQK